MKDYKYYNEDVYYYMYLISSSYYSPYERSEVMWSIGNGNKEYMDIWSYDVNIIFNV